MELSDKSHFIWYNIVKTILLEDFRMEETLKWALPVVIPLIISVSTALISSKSTIKKTKEETAKEIASIREETAKEIARVNAETSKELEIIKAQTEKDLALFKVQQAAKKENAQDEMVNQIAAQVIKSFLEPSAQGKDIKETMDRLKQLKDLTDSL